MSHYRNEESKSGYSRRMNADNVEELSRGTLMDSDSNEKAIPFKVCLIGDSDVGKTCIVERYINNHYGMQ